MIRRVVAVVSCALALACGSGERAGTPGGPAAGASPTGGAARAEDPRAFVAFPAAGVPNSNPDTVPDPGIVNPRDAVVKVAQTIGRRRKLEVNWEVTQDNAAVACDPQLTRTQ